jgi:hypothetical protein
MVTQIMKLLETISLNPSHTAHPSDGSSSWPTTHPFTTFPSRVNLSKPLLLSAASEVSWKYSEVENEYRVFITKYPWRPTCKEAKKAGHCRKADAQ